MKMLNKNETQMVSGGYSLNQLRQDASNAASKAAEKAEELAPKIGQAAENFVGSAADVAADVADVVAPTPTPTTDCKAPTICDLCNCAWYILGSDDGSTSKMITC